MKCISTKLLKSITNRTLMVMAMKGGIKPFFTYLDMMKDTLLWITIILALGGLAFFMQYPTSFATAVSSVPK